MTIRDVIALVLLRRKSLEQQMLVHVTDALREQVRMTMEMNEEVIHWRTTIVHSHRAMRDYLADLRSTEWGLSDAACDSLDEMISNLSDYVCQIEEHVP